MTEAHDQASNARPAIHAECRPDSTVAGAPYSGRDAGARHPNLPVLASDTGSYGVVDPDTGELHPVEDASDRALAAAANRIAEIDRELWIAKRAIGTELSARHGIGSVHAGGYRFTIAQAQSWPRGATTAALDQLHRAGHITAGDVARAMPDKPTPDARALKALAGRLTVTNPDAARILADACTVSTASVRDVQIEAVDALEAGP